jgi:Family of unknown function (DUF6114)
VTETTGESLNSRRYQLITLLANGQRGQQLALVLIFWGGAAQLSAGLLLASIGYRAGGAYPFLDGLNPLCSLPGFLTLTAGTVAALRPPCRLYAGTAVLGAAVASIPLALGGFLAGLILGVLGACILLTSRPSPKDLTSYPADERSVLDRTNGWRKRSRLVPVVITVTVVAVSLGVMSSYVLVDLETTSDLTLHPLISIYKLGTPFTTGQIL